MHTMSLSSKAMTRMGEFSWAFSYRCSEEGPDRHTSQLHGWMIDGKQHRPYSLMNRCVMMLSS